MGGGGLYNILHTLSKYIQFYHCFPLQSNCLLITNFDFQIQLSLQPDGVTYDFQTLTI